MMKTYNEEKGKSKRGLASADPEVRRRVASAGGRASRGGGRPRGT